MNPEDLMQAIATEKLGAPTAGATPPATPGAAPGAAAPPAEPPKASDAPTAQEQGAAKAAPVSTGDEPAFEFVSIDDGEGGKRDLTHQQIKGTMDRYRDLNHRWQTDVAPVKPVLALAKKLMDAAKAGGHEANGDELAQFIESAVKAYASNPQMGGGGKTGAPPMGGEANPNQGDNDDGALSAWEKENAVKLPPGYRENVSATKELSSKLDRIMGLLSQTSSAGGVLQQREAEATGQVATAHAAQLSAAKQAVVTNIKGAMMAAKLTPEDLPDFQSFAQARGYGPEDFIDPELTKTVVGDFAANRQAPEIERLRSIAARRQAFTGVGTSAPGGSAATPQAPADPLLAQLTDAAMASRNMR